MCVFLTNISSEIIMEPEISDQEKVRIVSDFILHAPPGEFNEVFNDVRELLKNDTLLKEGASNAFAQYNKDQLTPVRIEQSQYPGLITEYNDLGKFLSLAIYHFFLSIFTFWVGGGRFYDPRTKQSFKYEHLRKEASEYQPYEADPLAESWRTALDIEALAYTANHYRHGVCSVFGKSSAGQISLAICMEDHQFQPKNYWNGRWRSQWNVHFTPGSSTGEVKGVLKVQV